MFGETKHAEQYPMPQRGGDYFWEVSKEEAVAAVSSAAESPSNTPSIDADRAEAGGGLGGRDHCSLSRRASSYLSFLHLGDIGVEVHPPTRHFFVPLLSM